MKPTKFRDLDVPGSLGLPFTSLRCTEAAAKAMGLDGSPRDMTRVHLAMYEMLGAARAVNRWSPILTSHVDSDGVRFSVHVALSRHEWKDRPDTATVYSIDETPDASWYAVRPPSAEELADREAREREEEDRRRKLAEESRIARELAKAKDEIRVDLAGAILELQQRAGLRDPVDGRRLA